MIVTANAFHVYVRANRVVQDMIKDETITEHSRDRLRRALTSLPPPKEIENARLATLCRDSMSLLVTAEQNAKQRQKLATVTSSLFTILLDTWEPAHV